MKADQEYMSLCMIVEAILLNRLKKGVDNNEQQAHI